MHQQRPYKNGSNGTSYKSNADNIGPSNSAPSNLNGKGNKYEKLAKGPISQA